MVILLTRLNGERFALAIDRIERVEERPDTVVTTSTGNSYVVQESLEEMIRLVRNAKAAVFREFATGSWQPDQRLRVVDDPEDQMS